MYALLCLIDGRGNLLLLCLLLNQAPQRLPAEIQSAEYTTKQLLKAGMYFSVNFQYCKCAHPCLEEHTPYLLAVLRHLKLFTIFPVWS